MGDDHRLGVVGVGSRISLESRRRVELALTGASDRLAQIKQLGELKSAGLLNEAEFELGKARILSS